MDIENLKQPLGDETFAKLKAHVEELTSQRDAARTESIDGRKKLKAEVESLRGVRAKLYEKLGLDDDADLDALPDARGQADAVKQYETRLKKMERDLAQAAKDRDEIGGKYKQSLQRAAISEALGGHDFIARDLVESFVNQRLVWEGDDLMFKADNGNLIALKDGVAGIAKSRPELLKPTGSGGAGFKSGAGGAGAKAMTRAEFDALSPAQRMDAAKSGIQLMN